MVANTALATERIAHYGQTNTSTDPPNGFARDCHHSLDAQLEGMIAMFIGTWLPYRVAEWPKLTRNNVAQSTGPRYMNVQRSQPEKNEQKAVTRMQRDKESGFLYIASGRRRFTLQAMRSAKTLRHKLPDANITLMTDHIHDLNVSSYKVFSSVIVEDGLISRNVAEKFSWAQNSLKRVRVLKKTPYKKTILLDSDTIIRSNEIDNLFDDLNDYDIFLTTANTKTSRSASILGKKLYYGGIIGYRSDSEKIAALLDHWEKNYSENLKNLNNNNLKNVLFHNDMVQKDRQTLLQFSQLALAEILSPSENAYQLSVKELDANIWNHHAAEHSNQAIVETSPLVKFKDNIESEYGGLIPFPNQIVSTFLGLSNESRREISNLIQSTATSYGGHVSGQGGLRTKFNIHDTSNLAVQEFQDILMDHVNASAKRWFLDRSTYFEPKNIRRTEDDRIHFSISSWAYVLDAGAYIAPHQHVNAAISATYYVSVSPDIYIERQGGSIQIYNPNSAEGFTFRAGQMESVYSLYPSPDQFIMFPSYFWHSVSPVPIGGERIAVTFDILIA